MCCCVMIGVYDYGKGSSNWLWLICVYSVDLGVVHCSTGKKKLTKKKLIYKIVEKRNF